MRRSLPLIFSLFFLSGCNTALKIAYGIKNPGIEDQKSINKYLLRKHVEKTNVYVFKDIQSYKAASKMKLMKIPDALFFNAEGDFVSYKKTPNDCSAKVDAFLADLVDFSKLPTDKSFKIDDILSLITKMDGNVSSKSQINVFITWTKFAGNLNDEKAFTWINLINSAKAKGVDVNYYLLNCDFQKNWKLSEHDKKVFGIKN